MQSFSKARNVALCLKLPLVSYTVKVNSNDTSETMWSAGLSEPAMFAYVISTLFIWAGSNDTIKHKVCMLLLVLFEL